MLEIKMVSKPSLYIWNMHEGDYFRPTGSDNIMLKTGELRNAIELKTGKLVQVSDSTCLEKLDKIEMRVFV